MTFGRQARPVTRPGRRDRGHGGRLHEGRRMGLGARDADRVQGVGFVERVRDAAPVFGGALDKLVGEFDDGGRGRRAG